VRGQKWVIILYRILNIFQLREEEGVDVAQIIKSNLRGVGEDGGYMIMVGVVTVGAKVG
jgi:hypothetical protein